MVNMRIAMLTALVAVLALTQTVYVDAWFGWASTYCGGLGNGTLSDIAKLSATNPKLYKAPAGFIDGSGSSARFASPMGITVDSAANYLYVADQHNHAIRKLSLCGDGDAPQGTAAVCETSTLDITYPDDVTASLRSPTALAMDSKGHLFVTNKAVDIIRLTHDLETDSYVASVYASLPQTSSWSDGVLHATLDLDDMDNLYIADGQSHAIGRGSSSGSFTRDWCGRVGVSGPSVSSVSCSSATFNHPRGLYVTPDGSRVFVADSGNRVIRVIHVSTRTVTVWAGDASCTANTYHEFTSQDATNNGLTACFSKDIRGITMSSDGYSMYVLDAGFGVIRKVYLTTPWGPAGRTERFTGFPNTPGFTDGSASYRDLPSPYNVWNGYAHEQIYDPQSVVAVGDNLFFTDGQARIRRVVTGKNYATIHRTCPASATKAPLVRVVAPLSTGPNPHHGVSMSILTSSSTVTNPSCSRQFFGGVVDGYNLWVFQGWTSMSSDVEGAAAAGGDVNLENYSLGAKQSTNTINLVVGGSLTWTNGGLYGQGLVQGNVNTQSIGNNVPITAHAQLPSPGSTYISSQLSPLQTLADSLSTNSQGLSSCPTSLSSSTWTVTGLSNQMCRVSISASTLASYSTIIVQGDATAVVVIVVTGSSFTFQNKGMQLTGGITFNSVLYVLPSATSITMSSIGFYGSILAPQAAVTFNNGQLNGQLIAKSYNGGGQINLHLFCSKYPTTTTQPPTTKAPTTQAPTTKAPTTKAPTTQTPTTQTPTTKAPTTQTPTTKAPTTQSPTTKAPTTQTPTTKAPTTQTPTTQTPTTKAPTTQTPTTKAPTTQTPTTQTPTTKAPTTKTPTTKAPTTQTPTTKTPTTPTPTTKAPTTAAPTTPCPTTKAPTTPAATTRTPTTSAPSTPAPTTLPPTTAPPTDPCYQLLLPAEGWSVFTQLAANLSSNVEIGGRTAVGTDANYFAVTLGTALSAPSLASQVSHIVGNKIGWTQGTQFSSLTYGAQGDFKFVQLQMGATQKQAQPSIDFQAKAMALQQQAINLQQNTIHMTTPQVAKTSTTLTITVNPNTISTYQISGKELSAMNQIMLTIPATSTLVIVVFVANGDPATVQLFGPVNFSGSFESKRLLWVFPTQTSIRLSGIDMKGSILAPQATFTMNKPQQATQGSLDGQIIAKNLVSTAVSISCTLMCGPRNTTTTPPPTTSPPTTIKGDPQFNGFQGQSYQIHGAPDEIFSVITSPRFQLNGNFVYLGAGHCTYKNTPCWTHPGTYIDKIGIRFPSPRLDETDPLLRDDRIKLISASHSHGMRVWVNDEEISPSEQVHVLGATQDNTTLLYPQIDTVEITHPLFSIKIVNSDYFFNMDVSLRNQEWLAAGAHHMLVTAENKDTAYPTDIPLHGLLGQTWKNAVYGKGHLYEGEAFDYMVSSGDLFGTDFEFNLYESTPINNDEL